MTTSESQATAPRLDIANVVAAFSEEQIERMLGLSKSRLRYWARTDFFKPSYVEEEGRLPDSRFYAFKDVVALRTLERSRSSDTAWPLHVWFSTGSTKTPMKYASSLSAMALGDRSAP